MYVEYDDGRVTQVVFAETMRELAEQAIELADDPGVKCITIYRTGNPKKDPNQRRKALRAEALRQTGKE